MKIDINAYYEEQHLVEMEKVAQSIPDLYDRVVRTISTLIAAGASSAAINRKLDTILKEMAGDIETKIEAGAVRSWKTAEKRTNALLRDRYGDSVAAIKHNQSALEQFLKNKDVGLSKRIWKQSKQFKKLINDKISEGLQEGRSATKVAKELREALKNPKTQEKPGQGVYKSPVRNTQRLARTVINMAHRSSDQKAWENNPLILGYSINLSATGKPKVRCELCRAMAGDYPVSFVWSGWHPHCYSNDTEVLTRNGWKYFRDVNISDLIFSLNPITKRPEYVKVNAKLQKSYNGEMIRFHSRNLDILVTPDHPMKYLNKTDRVTFSEKEAKDYKNTNGSLYRSSNYNSPSIREIKIGSQTYDFDNFCKFMAYFLSDGSVCFTRKNQFYITQDKEKSPKQYETIKNTLVSMGLKFSEVSIGFYICNEDWYNYLKPFGKAPNKFIPSVILNSSPKQIGLFLDAYSICDGTIKSPKTFMGNRGGLFTSKKAERSFFTSSDQLAADLGECLVKIGRRPSYKLQRCKGIPVKHRNGTYSAKKDVWVVRECHSETASVFEKTLTSYSGIVYDLQLEKNHIMYVRRNGKCVWGSNCLCFKTPILMSRALLDKYNKLIAQGKDTPEAIASLQKGVRVTDIPPGTKSWYMMNYKRVAGWKSQPFWLRDNKKVFDSLLG